MDTAIVPEGCTKFIQAPNVVHNGDDTGQEYSDYKGATSFDLLASD